MEFLAAASTGLAVGGIAYLRATRTDQPADHKNVKAAVAGLEVSRTQFWLTIAFVAGVTFLVVYAVTGLPIVSLVPALVVATLPRTYFIRRRAQRLARVQEAWPDGLRDILASVRSGSSLPMAIESLASFGPASLREVFQGFDVYSRSMGVVPALEMVKEDLGDAASDRVIEVLILAYQRGGTAVPEILSDLADSTTRDLWAMEQIATEALEQKINSRIVFILPWLVLVAITARPGPFRDFYGSAGGVLVVVVGGVLSLVGIAVASRLGRQPSEPRVFGDHR